MAQPTAGERGIGRPGLLWSVSGTRRRTTSSARATTSTHRRCRHAATPDMTGEKAGAVLLWLASRFLPRSAAKVQSDVDLGTS